MTAIRALLRKELLEVMRNRAALIPVAIVAVVGIVMPFAVAVFVPLLSGQRLGTDADLVGLTRVAHAPPHLSADAQVQWFLFQQFLMMFLLMPITGAMTLAAHSVVSEKQARTLEPLLAAPISTI